MKKIILIALAAIFAIQTQAQNVTNSPYSQYGLGLLADQSNGAGTAMAGLGIGWREHNQVNFQNPASYASLDSLSMIFDAAYSVQVTNFQEGSHRLNSNSSSFDYIVGGFKAGKRVGIGFGVMPYSNVGYNYYNTQFVEGTSLVSDNKTTFTNTYKGSGGYHQVFLGAAVTPFKGFSLGANFSYLWGDITRSVVNSYSDSYVNTLSKYYSSEARGYKLDLGAQYSFKVSANDVITAGVVYSNGHSFSSDPTCLVISTNSQTAVADTTNLKSDGDLELPTSYGAGIVWTHNKQLRLGFDYSVQKWSEVKYPRYNVVNDKPQYLLREGLFTDRQKFTLGGEYCKGEYSRRFFDRVRIRAGVSYTTPYLIINGNDGPKEMSATVGFGIPIMNGYNNRSILNVSAQWSRFDATNLIKENTFRISVGLTFNERWFAKWKVE